VLYSSGHYATRQVAEGLVVAVVMAIGSVAIGTRTFRKENA
jgi:hypothetical protein